MECSRHPRRVSHGRWRGRWYGWRCPAGASGAGYRRRDPGRGHVIDVASIFGPFAADLWYAILGAIVFVALILWLLDKILHAPAAEATRDAKGDTGTEGSGKERSYLYLASALVLTVDEPGDTSPSPSSLLFRVACIFIGVVVSSTCVSRAEALDAVSRGHPAVQVHGEPGGVPDVSGI